MSHKKQHLGIVSLQPFNPFTAMNHLKTTNKSAKFETRQPFFFSAQACERTVIKTRGIESRCVIGPEDILSAHFQPGHFTGWGSEG